MNTVVSKDDEGSDVDVKAPSTESSLGPRKRPGTFSRTEMYPTTDVSDRHPDVFEVGRTSAADTIKGIRLQTFLIKTD